MYLQNATAVRLYERIGFTGSVVVRSGRRGPVDLISTTAEHCQ